MSEISIQCSSPHLETKIRGREDKYPMPGKEYHATIDVDFGDFTFPGPSVSIHVYDQVGMDPEQILASVDVPIDVLRVIMSSVERLWGMQ